MTSRGKILFHMQMLKKRKEVWPRENMEQWTFIVVCIHFTPLNESSLNSNKTFLLRSLADVIIFKFSTVMYKFLKLKNWVRSHEIFHAAITFLRFLNHCSWNTVKIIAQSLTAKMRLPRVLSKTFMIKLQRTDHTSELHFTKISTTHNSKQPWAGVNCLIKWLTREEKDSDVELWTSRLQHGKRHNSISY